MLLEANVKCFLIICKTANPLNKPAVDWSVSENFYKGV